MMEYWNDGILEYWECGSFLILVLFLVLIRSSSVQREDKDQGKDEEDDRGECEV